MNTQEQMKTTITCKIQNSKRAKFKLLAKNNNCTLSAMTRKLIYDFINERPQKTEIKIIELPKDDSYLNPIVFGKKINE